MASLRVLVAAVAFVALPGLAGAGSVDLPRLTFPDASGDVVTQGCADQTTLGTAAPCTDRN